MASARSRRAQGRRLGLAMLPFAKLLGSLVGRGDASRCFTVHIRTLLAAAAAAEDYDDYYYCYFLLLLLLAEIILLYLLVVDG